MLDLELSPSAKVYLDKIIWERGQLYMNIEEVSKKYNVTLDALDSYEKLGLIPKANIKTDQFREYTEEDCRWIHFIKVMIDEGISTEVLGRVCNLASIKRMYNQEYRRIKS